MVKTCTWIFTYIICKYIHIYLLYVTMGNIKMAAIRIAWVLWFFLKTKKNRKKREKGVNNIFAMFYKWFWLLRYWQTCRVHRIIFCLCLSLSLSFRHMSVSVTKHVASRAISARDLECASVLFEVPCRRVR